MFCTTRVIIYIHKSFPWVNVEILSTYRCVSACHYHASVWSKCAATKLVLERRYGHGESEREPVETRRRAAYVFILVYLPTGSMVRKFSRRAQRRHCKRLLISRERTWRARTHTHAHTRHSIRLSLYSDHTDGHCSLKIPTRGTIGPSRRVTATRKRISC